MALNMLRILVLASALIAGNCLGYSETIGRFHVEQGVATDSATGLMWMRCPLGMKWGDNLCSGKPTRYKWDEAMQTANRLSYAGHKNWRVPTIDELKTLIDNVVGNSDIGIPYINNLVFPRTLYREINGEKSATYWSSSPVAGYSYYAWVVFFLSGIDFWYYKYGYSFVRLVRNGE